MSQDYVNGVHQFSLDSHSVLAFANDCELFQSFNQWLVESKIEKACYESVHVKWAETSDYFFTFLQIWVAFNYFIINFCAWWRLWKIFFYLASVCFCKIFYAYKNICVLNRLAVDFRVEFGRPYFLLYKFEYLVQIFLKEIFSC